MSDGTTALLGSVGSAHKRLQQEVGRGSTLLGSVQNESQTQSLRKQPFAVQGGAFNSPLQLDPSWRSELQARKKARMQHDGPPHLASPIVTQNALRSAKNNSPASSASSSSNNPLSNTQLLARQKLARSNPHRPTLTPLEENEQPLNTNDREFLNHLSDVNLSPSSDIRVDDFAPITQPESDEDNGHFRKDEEKIAEQSFVVAKEEKLEEEKKEERDNEAEKEEVFWARMSELKEKLLSSKVDELQGFGVEDECEQLEELVTRAVQNGESSSTLLVGPPGCGKSFVIKKSLGNVRKKKLPFLQVTLDGLIHTDDVMALREITRQLSLGNHGGIPSKTATKASKGTFAQHLRFLLSILFEGAHTGSDSGGIPLVFILDHFEAFARRRKQTLLYNLLDLTQSRDARLVLIGSTHRIDAVDQLEKRVRSRFDHREMILKHPSKETLEKILLERLVLQDSNKLHERWNERITKLVTTNQKLKSMHILGNTVGWYLRLFDFALARLRMQHRRSKHPQKLLSKDLTEARKALEIDVRLEILECLSMVEILLISSMIHLERVRETSAFNFEMVVAHALKFYKNEDQLEKQVSKAVAMKAFEHLLDLHIIVPSSESSSSGQGRLVFVEVEFRLVRLMIDPDDFLEEIKENKRIRCPVALQHWAIENAKT